MCEKTMDEAAEAAGEVNRTVDNVVKGRTWPAGRTRKGDCL